MARAHKLAEQFIHLGQGASAIAQPPFTGLDWYEGYAERTASDGAEGRLVSMYSFAEPWDSWEMHPKGSEVVICVSGEMTLIQEAADGTQSRVTLQTGDYAINEPGVWHTADVTGAAVAVFITAGEGTEHRPR